MFDIGWSEMVFVAIIAVLVIGPKDLPRAIATVGKYVRKIRNVAREFQSGIDDIARESELDELKKSVQGDDFNIKKQVENAVDPTGDFGSMFDDEKKPATEKPKTDNPAADKPSDSKPADGVSEDSKSATDTGSTDTKVPT